MIGIKTHIANKAVKSEHMIRKRIKDRTSGGKGGKKR